MVQDSKPTTASQEVDAWWGSYSLRMAVPCFLCNTVVCAVLVSVSWLIMDLDLAQFLVEFLIILIWSGQALWWVLRVFGRNYRLTTQRLFLQRGPLRRRMWEVNLAQVKEVVVERGPIHKLFGIGCIVVTADASPHVSLVLDGVFAPDQLAEKIEALARQAKLTR